MASLSNPFSYNRKVKIVLSGRRKMEKRKGNRDSWAVVGSTPNIQRVSFPRGWVGPASSILGAWAGGCLGRAHRDRGFPCRVPVLQQGFGQLSLGNNLYKRKHKVEILVIYLQVYSLVFPLQNFALTSLLEIMTSVFIYFPRFFDKPLLNTGHSLLSSYGLCCKCECVRDYR